MKRLAFVLLACLGPLTGCLEFDALLDAGCAADASWAECREQPAADAGLDTDAGLAADAGADAGLALDGGFCSSSGWCWENPSLPGAIDLFAVWGTSDTDVWVAGAGGVVLRFNGTRWWQVAVSLDPQPSLAQLEPAVRAVSVDDAGVTWLVGERMAPTGLAPSGVRRAGPVTDRIAAVTFAGTTWFLPAGASPFSLERLGLGDTAPTLVSVNVAGADNLASMTANEAGVLVAYDRVSPEPAEVFSLSTTSRAPLTSPRTREVRTPRNFARRGATTVLVCANGDAFESSGAGWAWFGQVPLGQDLRTHAIDALADGGSRWWFAGGSGALASTDDDLDAGLTTYGTGGGETLHASWLSPAGHFWAVGSAGAVLETRAGGATVRRGALPDYALFDLALSGSTAVAVGRGGVSLSRDPTTGEWSRTEDPATIDLRAVALGPLGTCTLDLLGDVFCSQTGTWSSGARQADGGVFPLGLRSGGAISQRADGGAVMGVGTTVAIYRGGAWGALDAGLTRNNLSDLALTPNGFAVAVNETSANDALGNGAVVIFDGANRSVCAPSVAAPLLGLARTTSGFLVVGPNTVGECSATGVFTAVSTPVARTWVSAWVDAVGGWWILDDSGFVLRRPPGGTWQRERLPLGESGLDGPATTRITGDDDEGYGVGKSGTVLRRRLP